MDQDKLKYIGILEIETPTEMHDFHIMENSDNELLAGSVYNSGFLPEYKFDNEHDYSDNPTDLNLQDFLLDLECHLNDNSPSGSFHIL